MCPSIDVVMPVFNHYELTAQCLLRLHEQTIPHQTIVVDDSSTDQTRERLAADWPAVSVLSLDENHGYAKACNRGVAAGEGEIVVLLNNDVDCPPGFLERLVKPLADPRVGSVASLMLMSDAERIDSIGLATDVTLAGFPRLQGQPRSRATETGEHIPVLAGPAGTAAAYRRIAWDQVGGLDERISAYMEDLDLALRLRICGWDSVAAADAVGVHLGSATYGHRSAGQRRSGGFSRGYLLRHYGILRGRGAVRTLATETVVVLGDLVMSRDLAATRGRLAGWRAGGRGSRLPHPPREAIDTSITFRDSLALRRGVYGQRAA